MIKVGYHVHMLCPKAIREDWIGMIERSTLTRSLVDRPPTSLRERPDSIATIAGQKSAGELWKTIQEILPDVRIQRLAYLLFHCDLRPREIVHFCSEEFNDLQEIYRLYQDILEQMLLNNIFAEEE
jgi:hypothetical protein